MWLGWREVQPLFSPLSPSSSASPLSQMMSVSRTQRITVCRPRLPTASGPTKFWWKLEKGSESREDQISGSIGTRKCWSPPERACGITILPIKQREPGQPSERDLPLTGVREDWTGEGERVEGKRKVSRIHRLNEGLSGQTYRIGAGTVEWELVCRDWRRAGGACWSLYEA